MLGFHNIICLFFIYGRGFDYGLLLFKNSWNKRGWPIVYAGYWNRNVDYWWRNIVRLVQEHVLIHVAVAVPVRLFHVRDSADKVICNLISTRMEVVPIFS